MEFLSKIEAFFSSTMASRVLSSVVILIVGLIIIKIAIAFLKKALKSSRLDAALHTFIINTSKVLMLVLLVITLLGNLGVPTTTFVTVIGACGAAIALALRDSLANFAGGILILINKPFEKGDYIEASGVGGKVEKIDLLYSTLVTLDNKVISIPNGKLSTDVVVNFSRADRRRVDTKFGIGYDDDIGEAKKVIHQIIERANLFLDDPAPTIGVAAYGESAVEIEVLAWCKTENYYPAKYYLQEEVKRAFDENGIEIPYPQTVVHFSIGDEKEAGKKERKETGPEIEAKNREKREDEKEYGQEKRDSAEKQSPDR